MKINCPGCGVKFELEEATKDAAFRKILELAHKFGPDSRLFFEYVECFRKGAKPLSLKLELRLLEEAFALYDSGAFIFNRKEYHIPRPHLLEALKIICNKQLQGLENHNYLKKILTNNQEKTEASRERETELRKQNPYRSLQEPSETEKIRKEGTKDERRGTRDANGEELIPMPKEVAEAIAKIGKKISQ